MLFICIVQVISCTINLRLYMYIKYMYTIYFSYGGCQLKTHCHVQRNVIADDEGDVEKIFAAVGLGSRCAPKVTTTPARDVTGRTTGLFRPILPALSPLPMSPAPRSVSPFRFGSCVYEIRLQARVYRHCRKFVIETLGAFYFCRVRALTMTTMMTQRTRRWTISKMQ